MLRSREDLTKFFSDEIIDKEIERVKRAAIGDTVFSCEDWEVDDFIVSVLSYANVNYVKRSTNGTKLYIKAQQIS